MLVHLVDGTYELFRHFYAMPPEKNPDGLEVAAIQGVLASMLGMINSGGARYLGVATDHVIESFRNRLWSGYKTGAGIDQALLAQFHPLEQALSAMGVVVFPWWSSRPTMRWRPRRRWLPPIRASRAC